MTRRLVIAPRFIGLHPDELRRIADDWRLGEVTRRGAEDALYALESNRRPPEIEAWWEKLRAEWEGEDVRLTDDARRSMVTPTTQTAKAPGAETPDALYAEPLTETGGRHE